MDKKEFAQARHFLGKTQNELAKLLCVSSKAIQSFEQGWRKVSDAVERQLLFLISLKIAMDKTTAPCWELRNCSSEMRARCPAWEFQAGYFCWFISGTICQGDIQKNWKEKIQLCRKCEVYKSMFSAA
jgi:DNA-binding XRE family transcriptional regulator